MKILTFETDHYERGELMLPAGELVDTSLFTEGWTSTVSLGRVATTPDTEALRARLGRESIHLLVSPRWSENEPGVVLAFAERENRLPFTYPEIKVLRALAEIADRLYTRARFSLQARQAEQLAAIGLIGAGLAHELRNPIVTIGTFAELLPKRLNDATFLREFAEVLPGETKRVQALAEQLLDLARPRKYEFKTVDLSEVIAESLFLLRQRADAAHVTLSMQPNRFTQNVVADPQALRQVLLNLVLNSIQSIGQTGRSGHVVVRTRTAGDHVIIETKDDGPGIPDSVRHRLFQPFSSGNKVGGLGLGLAICAEIAKVHRGRISAEPCSEGARFHIVLPIGGPNAAVSPPPLIGRPDFVLPRQLQNSLHHHGA